jgi:hypothetical protein
MTKRQSSRQSSSQLPRRYYGIGALIGAGLGLVAFVANRVTAHGEHRLHAYASAHGLAQALLFVVGGVVLGVALVAIVRFGLRVQRRDVPPSDGSVA